NAPMIAIYHDTYEDLTAERLSEIIDAFQAGKGDSIKPGPQIDRLHSAAEGGRTTLLEQPSATREKFVPPAPPAEAVVSAPAAAPQAPTTAAKPRDVSEESAPALKGTPKEAKLSEAKAEGERKAAAVSANAD